MMDKTQLIIKELQQLEKNKKERWALMKEVEERKLQYPIKQIEVARKYKVTRQYVNQLAKSLKEKG